MSETLDALKALIAPAVIALILFIVTNYVALPLWRQYQNRYSQYIPVRSITTHTDSARLKLQALLARWLVPSNWRRTRIAMGVDVDDAEPRLSEDSDYVSVDEEELEDVYVNNREAGDRRHGLSLDTRYPSPRLDDSSRRLSRDLEQGFRDDSDSEEDDPRQRR